MQRLKKGATLEEGTDHELLGLGRAGNEEAFLALYHRRHKTVFRFTLHMSGSCETAEEVVQEVFLALLANVSYSQQRGSLEGFLIGMARNQVRRHLRDTRRAERSRKSLQAHPSTEETCNELCRESDLEAMRSAILALPETIGR